MVFSRPLTHTFASAIIHRILLRTKPIFHALPIIISIFTNLFLASSINKLSLGIMIKEVEHHQHMQQAYPASLPSAPPTYDEAMYHQGAPHPQYAAPPPPVFNNVPPAAAGSSYYVPPPVVQVQRTIIALPLGPNPARIKCPQCQAEILTRTETEPSCAAHLCCLLLFIVGCCPFSSLPYFMDSMKNVRHVCPNCKVYLGSYQP